MRKSCLKPASRYSDENVGVTLAHRVHCRPGTGSCIRPDGRELFYISPDERLMALQIELNADARPRVLAPVLLFQTKSAAGAVAGSEP